MIERPFHRALFLSVLLSLFFTAGNAAGADEDVLEYKLKAAFILNFSKLTTWPQDSFNQPEKTFNFCVAGVDPFGTALDGVESKQVGGRNVRLHFIPSLSEIQACDVLYVSKSEQKNLIQLQKFTDGTPTITVSDIDGFSSKGGIFEFVTKGGRLSFIVNNQQATRNGLQISASLLNLAAEVL